jgi:hypothetical protein
LIPPPSCKKQPLQNKPQTANLKRPNGGGVQVSCSGGLRSSENAKTYEANRSKRGGIGCGLRFGSRARAIIYVYYPPGTYL